jgi:enamine deaminase RidA (YjgF/YER057c/UK114 family)
VAHEEIRSEKVFKNPNAPFSLGTRSTGGTLVHVSGQVAQGPDGHTVGKGTAMPSWPPNASWHG